MKNFISIPSQLSANKENQIYLPHLHAIQGDQRSNVLYSIINERQITLTSLLEFFCLKLKEVLEKKVFGKING